MQHTGRLWAARRRREREDNCRGKQTTVIFPVKERPVEHPVVKQLIKEVPMPICTNSPCKPTVVGDIASRHDPVRYALSPDMVYGHCLMVINHIGIIL